MKKVWLVILMSSFITLFISRCTSYKKLKTFSLDEMIENPLPGTVPFEGNLFLDKTELTTLSWREYLWWLSHNYGKQSNEYLNALPDTNVWLKPEACYTIYSEIYLRHPAYAEHPVVGVSQEQIRDFSKWRSDRVMELFLVRDERMVYEGSREDEDLFTIEKYFQDSLDYIIEDVKLEYYPEYRLPTLAERKRILIKQDSIGRSTYKRTRNNWKSWDEFYLSQIRADIPSCSSLVRVTAPTKAVYFGSNLGQIDNLRGNVREYVEEESLAVGGSWYDSKKRIFDSDTFHVSSPNAWTGFRNVCEWKKWEK